MLKNFNTVHAPGSLITITNSKGEMIQESSVANIGYLQGSQRKISAVLCDGAFDNDQWYVYNITNKDGLFLDHFAVRGAVSAEQSESLLKRYLTDSAIYSVEQLSEHAMSRFLDSSKQDFKTSYLLADDALQLNTRVFKDQVAWDEENLSSHGGQISKLLFDMVCHDDKAELLAHTTVKEAAAIVLDGSEALMADAMVIKYKQFDKSMQKIAEALKSASDNTFQIASVTPIQPFKKNNVVNVGMIFEMSDTQTITVLFNNPDTTPSKLAPEDVLTSWKWILNKRDVTPALQPKATDSKRYGIIAKRMMLLLAKNHPRFVRAQAERLRIEREITDGQESLKVKQDHLVEVQRQISDVQDGIDMYETHKKQKETEVGKVDDQRLETEYATGILNNYDDLLSQSTNFNDNLNKEELEAAEELLSKLNEIYPLIQDIFARGIKGIDDWSDKNDSYKEAQLAIESQESTIQRVNDRIEVIKAHMNAAEDHNLSHGDGFEITKPENYAATKASGQLDTYQDELDSYFQSRIIGIRNALRELGWEGERFKTLYVSNYAFKAEFVQTGAGANIVGAKYSILDPDGQVIEGATLVDDLTLSETEIAKRMNDCLPPDLITAEDEATKEAKLKTEPTQPTFDDYTKSLFEHLTDDAWEKTDESGLKWTLKSLRYPNCDLQFSGDFLEATITDNGEPVGVVQRGDLDPVNFETAIQIVVIRWTDLKNAKNGGTVLKKEAEDTYRTIDWRITDYQGHTADEFKRAKVKESLSALIEIAQAVLARKFRNDEYRERIEQSIANAKKMITRWESVQDQPKVENTDSPSQNNELYQSIIDGKETVSIKLLQQLRSEAVNNPDDPLLAQALQVLLSQMSSLVVSGNA